MAGSRVYPQTVRCRGACRWHRRVYQRILLLDAAVVVQQDRCERRRASASGCWQWEHGLYGRVVADGCNVYIVIRNAIIPRVAIRVFSSQGNRLPWDFWLEFPIWKKYRLPLIYWNLHFGGIVIVTNFSSFITRSMSQPRAWFFRHGLANLHTMYTLSNSSTKFSIYPLVLSKVRLLAAYCLFGCGKASLQRER